MDLTHCWDCGYALGAATAVALTGVVVVAVAQWLTSSAKAWHRNAAPFIWLLAALWYLIVSAALWPRGIRWTGDETETVRLADLAFMVAWYVATVFARRAVSKAWQPESELPR